MFGLFRLILAFNVVLYHLLSLPAVGPLAVYTFFVLSGFLMTTIMHKTYSYSTKGVAKYAINRCLRLYPTYWILLLITVGIILLVGSDFSSSFHSKMVIPSNASEIMANITLIYPSFYPVTFSPRVAPATWALTIELFFYLLIGLGLSKNKKITIFWLLLSIFYIVHTNIQNSSLGIGYGNILTSSLPFSIGATLFFYKDKITHLLNKFRYSYFSIITVFTCNIVLTSIGMLFLPEQAWKFDLIGTYLNLILTAFVIVALLDKQRFHFLGKSDKFLGDLSYPVYVFHWGGACLFAWLLSNNSTSEVEVERYVIFIGGTVITIAFSIIVNNFINKYVEKYRRVIKKNSTIPSQLKQI